MEDYFIHLRPKQSGVISRLWQTFRDVPTYICNRCRIGNWYFSTALRLEIELNTRPGQMLKLPHLKGGPSDATGHKSDAMPLKDKW